MRIAKKSTETKTAGKTSRRPRSSAYGGAKTIDEYLARIEPDQRAALEALRQVIRKAAPKAEEVITYGIPAFKQNGFLLGFAASAKHCSLHPMNNHTVADFAERTRRLQHEHGHCSLHPGQAAASGRRREDRQGENRRECG